LFRKVNEQKKGAGLRKGDKKYILTFGSKGSDTLVNAILQGNEGRKTGRRTELRPRDGNQNEARRTEGGSMKSGNVANGVIWNEKK